MSTTTNSRFLRFVELVDFTTQVAMSGLTYLFSIEFLANHGYTLYPFIAASLIYLVFPYAIYTSPFWLRNQKKNKKAVQPLINEIHNLKEREESWKIISNSLSNQLTLDSSHRRDIHAKSLACRRWKRKAKALHREVRKLRGELGKTSK